MNSPLVSIGLPVFNGEKWIARALGSLLKQDYSNIEIVVSDNASTDNTMSIIKEFAKESNKVHPISNEINIGQWNNFRKVLSESRGKYFFWAGVDDYWETTFVSSLVAELELDDKYAAALPATILISENSGEEKGRIRFKGKYCPNGATRLTLTGMIVSPLKYNYYICGIFRRELLNQAIKYCPDIPSSDRWCLLQFALEYEFRYVDEFLYLRTIRDQPLYDRYPDDDLSKMKKIADNKWFDFSPVPVVWKMLNLSTVVKARTKKYIPVVIIQLFFQRVILGFRRAGRSFIVRLMPRAVQKYLLRVPG